MSMTGLVVTIDGPAGSGKSTAARRLAARLDAVFLDTGAMYRAVTLAALHDGADLRDPRQVIEAMNAHRFDFEAAHGHMLVRIDGQDATEAIRDNELTAQVRHVAAAPTVRERLVAMQKAFAAGHRRLVTEGRDQGTVVFPDADVKFYLVADVVERARRRAAELQAQGADVDLRQIRQQIDIRDRGDENRTAGPLKPAADAIVVDTSDLSIDEVVERLYRHVVERRGPAEPAPPAKAGRGGRPDHAGQAQGTAPASETSRFASCARGALPAIWYRLAQFGCRVFCGFFFRFRAYGRQNIPRHGGVILASNHQSYLDPVFCGVAIRRRLCFVARDSLFRFRLFGLLIRSLNAIPIGRDKADVAAMRAIIARLREGRGVCLYPEGTRTHDGRIIPFKAGFGLLCRRAKAAVVPTLIDGAFECWPRHKRLFAPGHVVVCYGEVLTAEQIAQMGNEELADHLTCTLRRMQHDCRLKRGKQPYDYGA